MTHEQIASNEIVEKYIRGRLPEAEAAAFEEHYFACDECFQQVETMQRFVDGIRDAAESGSLPVVEAKPALVALWLRPAFYLAAAAAVVMSVTAGWLTLSEVPRLRQQLAAQQRELESSLSRVTQLETRISEAATSAVNVFVQPNLALVMLEASRAADGNQITVPPGATQFAVWVELDPNARYDSYRLEIANQEGQTVESLSGLLRNSYGAVAASVPTTKLVAGSYRARLFGVSGAKSSLTGEYRLILQR